MSSKLRFVSPRHLPQGGHEWIVKLAGAKRAAAIVPNKADAFDIARKMAKRAGEELAVQRLDGAITIKNSYGNDPPNVKG